MSTKSIRKFLVVIVALVVSITTLGGIKPIRANSGGKIAFTSDHRKQGCSDKGTCVQELYIMDSDGNNQQLLYAGMLGPGPDWSPDGKQLVFFGFCDTTEPTAVAICVINADGSGVRPLTRGLKLDFWKIKWSPDGQRIAFLASDEGNHLRFFIMNSDGSNVRQMSNDYSTDSFSWAPDGQSIVVAYGNCLRKKGLDGKGGELFQDSQETLDCHDPSWYRDGQHIAFTGQSAPETGGPQGIYILNVSTNVIMRLTEIKFPVSGPTWSSDGRQIAFAAALDDMKPEGVQIYVMNSNGTGLHTITDQNDDDRDPAWQP